MSGKNLSGQVAIVTGASRGIGKAISLALAAEGMNLALTATQIGNLSEVLDLVRSLGVRAEPFACDLANWREIPRLVNDITACFGSLDVLINNAGYSVRASLVETAPEDLERCMQVNAMAPFVLCQELFPFLCSSQQATVINIGSVVAFKGYEQQSAYGASKHALLGLSKVMALEWKKYGIRVHSINPGAVDTEMIRQMRPDLDPQGMIGTEDIADLIVFLLTHRGRAVIDDIHMRRATGDPWY